MISATDHPAADIATTPLVPAAIVARAQMYVDDLTKLGIAHTFADALNMALQDALIAAIGLRREQLRAGTPSEGDA